MLVSGVATLDIVRFSDGFLFGNRSFCGCLACRTSWLRWRQRLSAQHSTEPTRQTGPSRTTQTCGCLEGATCTKTSSARTNMLNTTSTVTCRTNWVGRRHRLCCVFFTSLLQIHGMTSCLFQVLNSLSIDVKYI